MTATAKRKPPAPSIPSLAARVLALLRELETASAEQQREVITLWRDVIDKRLDGIAEGLTPKGKLTVDACGNAAIVGAIPVGFVRQQLDIAGGHCNCKSMIEALKE